MWPQVGRVQGLRGREGFGVCRTRTRQATINAPKVHDHRATTQCTGGPTLKGLGVSFFFGGVRDFGSWVKT